MKIVIDPGHYKDCANRGRNGYNEGNAMYKLALMLQDELVRCKFETKLTRTEATNPSLYERGLIGAGADLFISLHSNAMGGKESGKARGVEVFYSVDILWDKDFALELATAIANLMGTVVRGAKTWESKNYPGEDYLGVVDSAQDNGAKRVLLVEHGFHDNLIEEAFLLQDSNLKLLAIANAKVICNYLGAAYIPEVVVVPEVKQINILLKKGSKGEQVKQLQKLLNIVQDGDFGPATEKAVKQFQLEHGLVVDGIVGNMTWGLLNK